MVPHATPAAPNSIRPALFTRTQGVAPARTKQSELNRRSLWALTDAARGRGRGRGASPAHGQVIAATSFGFWAMLAGRDRGALIGDTSRAHVHDPVYRSFIG